MYTDAQLLRENCYQVACISCGTDLGTMTSDILTDAINWALNRGGIKCPDCRRRSCKGCGISVPDGVTYCFFCRVEKESIDEVAACLVVQNSSVSGGRIA